MTCFKTKRNEENIKFLFFHPEVFPTFSSLRFKAKMILIFFTFEVSEKTISIFLQ